MGRERVELTPEQKQANPEAFRGWKRPSRPDAFAGIPQFVYCVSMWYGFLFTRPLTALRVLALCGSATEIKRDLGTLFPPELTQDYPK